MKAIAMLALLLSATASAAEWKAKTTTDSMTDATSTEASVENQDGDRFTVIRRSDGSVWGYLQLGGVKQFSVGERLMLRVDKNKPAEFNEDFEKLTRELKMPIEAWEWNPSLIGFRMWHGKADEGCGLVRQLYDGQQLVIRYHPNQSTIRDVVFSLSGNASALSQAVGLDLSTCPADKV